MNSLSADEHFFDPVFHFVVVVVVGAVDLWRVRLAGRTVGDQHPDFATFVLDAGDLAA